MIIDNNVLAISKCMFQERVNWKYVTDEQKAQFFFIFNRYFSKRFPELAQNLNNKSVDSVSGMNLWYHFMEGKPYPKWFWSKLEKSKVTADFSDGDISSLITKFQITEDELTLLIKYHKDEVKDELKYIKDGSK